MGPSADEIAARLAELRHRRAAIDREIADLLLYLELGRRLGGGGEATADPAGPAAVPAAAPEMPASLPDRVSPAAPPRPAPGRDHAGAGEPSARPAPPPGRTAPGPPAGRSGPSQAQRKDIPPPIAFAQDPAGARRYGRALIEAACAVIARAGRPLHAAEILEPLLAQGFTLPGRDPVAALNTRLWKRAGADGPLRRTGEATYALAEDPDPASGG